MKIILFLLLFPVMAYSQYKFEFADTVNGKVVMKQVGVFAPLPIELRLTADTLKPFQYQNGIMTVPTPIKLYNYILDLTKQISRNKI